ncbi:MAG: polysaccharide biosynthesis protein, partial [Oscillospiraceae bacterium]|nr:polysaccharide biosynthesis protein [Oscillospiraceae bacterium]
YEEKLMAEEGLKKTDNELIHIGEPIVFDSDKFLVELQELMRDAYDNRKDIKELTMKLVKTYHPA